jgi:hypothetical protein
MNYIVETIERPLSFLVKEKANPTKSWIRQAILLVFNKKSLELLLD